jgi:hypothetical protein
MKHTTRAEFGHSIVAVVRHSPLKPELNNRCAVEIAVRPELVPVTPQHKRILHGRYGA